MMGSIQPDSRGQPVGLATKLMIGLGTALWLMGVIRIFWPDPLVVDILSALLVCFVLLALPRTAWHTRLLLCALALATAGLASVYDRWDAVLLGLAKGSVFPAFLATIVLLRATADQRPEIATARRLFTAIDPRRQSGGLIIGSFLVGSILQVGVFAILAPILGRDATLEERRRVFLVAMRGMALVPLWSPFVVGMAVATVYLPSVPLWQVMALGLFLGTLGILLSVTLFDRTGGPATIWRALKTLVPIVPAISVAAFLVIGMTTISGYSTLQSLVIIIPVPCLLAVAFAPGGSVPQALRNTAMGLSRIGNETSILTFAMVLGITFETCLPAIGLLDILKSAVLSPTMIIFIVVMAMNIFGLLGVHSIVSGTILLVLFTSIPTGIADLVLLEAILIGWGLCTALSVGSLSIATGAAMFDLKPVQGISVLNIVYVFVASALFAAILAVINPLLTA